MIPYLNILERSVDLHWNRLKRQATFPQMMGMKLEEAAMNDFDRVKRSAISGQVTSGQSRIRNSHSRKMKRKIPWGARIPNFLVFSFRMVRTIRKPNILNIQNGRSKLDRFIYKEDIFYIKRPRLIMVLILNCPD